MEKFQKAYDGLKSGGTIKKKDGILTAKDKLSYCQSITEAVQSQQFKQHADYPKKFSLAFELLFTLYDDANSDVRVYVDECLNSIIRSNLAEGNASRIHVELYQEIRRNGPARCLRYAWTKFADLVHQIRPNKCRMFAKNLVPCLIVTLPRPEEAVQEFLGAVVEKVFVVLGRFFNDEETKKLVKAVLPGLQLQSAASRRTAAQFLVELCRNSRKRYVFVSYLFKTLLDSLVPIQYDQSVLLLLGTFFTIRSLIPILKTCEDDEETGEEVRITQTGTMKFRPRCSLSTEELIQLYEAIMYYLGHPHSSVLTAALETLNQLLLHCPRRLVVVLLSESEGITKTRIFATPSSTNTLSLSRKGSFSGLRSGLSSLGGSQTDLSNLTLGDLSIDDQGLFSGVEYGCPLTTFPLRTRTPDVDTDETPLITLAHAAGLDAPHTDPTGYSSIQMGEVVDDSSAPAIIECERKRNSKHLAPLNIIPIPSVDPMFSDPTSPLSPFFSKDMSIPEDIGSLYDTLPPLRYCGRLLCRKFLLEGETGRLITDKDVRVSHKVLALGCLESVCSLYPVVLEDFLFPSSVEGQRISDVLLYSNHDDPQIKGNVAMLASTWLKSVVAHNGHKIEALPQQVTCDVVQAISTTLLNDSGVALRLAVIAMTKCYRELLQYDASTGLRLLHQALTLSSSPYWLLKAAVAELLAEIDYCYVSAAEHSTVPSTQREEETFCVLAVQKLVNVLLADEDHRVRQAAATACVALVENLCLNSFPLESSFIGRYKSLLNDFEFSWHLDGFSIVHCLAPRYKLSKTGKQANSTMTVDNLAYLVDALVRTLCIAVEKDHMIGCLTALQRLSDSFPPSLFESAWCVTSGSKSGSSIELLWTLFSILKSVSFGADSLVVHQTLYSLIGSLFAGFALKSTSPKVTRKSELTSEHWSALQSSNLGELAFELFNFCLRTISIYWHVVTDQQPAPPPVLAKAPLPQLPQAASLTPVANRLKAVAGAKTDSKGQEGNSAAPAPPPMPSSKFKAADFYSSIYHMRVYEMLKGAWANYRINLDSEVEEKFCSLLRSCLDCLSTLLEVALFADVERFTEELLAYLKALMPILPYDVVNTVTQLLKTLFGTNLTLIFQSNQPLWTAAGVVAASLKVTHAQSETGVYHSCLVKQRAKYFNQLTSAMARHDVGSEMLKQHLGWFGIRGERHVVSLLKNSTHKTTLTNYIRLFEPVVVQCLRLYTSCVNADLQCAVIGLLSQLVQIRVNYSLLDTDRRFLEFLCQQLENIDDGQSRSVDILTRKLFEFFVLLSYEKSQSGIVMEVPKVLQLADGLLASSQNGKGTRFLGTYALHPVVMDLYFFRSSSKVESAKELEIQQEVVVSMLIKCIGRGGGALSLLSFILYQTRKENESKWRKLSRDVVDALLPLLSKGQMTLRTSTDLSCVFSMTDFLCASAFRPVDPILSLMLTSPSNTSTVEDFSTYLACQLWCLRALIMFSNETAVASRLEEMPSAVVGATWLIGSRQETEFVDPLGSTLRTDFEEIFARLLLSICKLSLERLYLGLVDRPNPSTEYLEQLCYYFTSTLVHLCHCGEYAKCSQAVGALLKSDLVTLDESVARSCPLVAVQWFYLLSVTKSYDAPCWKLASLFGISPVLRRCIVMLYCDRVKEVVASGKDLSILDDFLSNNLDVFDWFDEPPVKGFLSEALDRSTSCRLTISKLADVLLEEPYLKPSRAMNLLQCLELANDEASVMVLDVATDFITRCNRLALTKMAASLALRKLEVLMVSRAEETKAELTVDVLNTLLSRFDSARKRRFGLLHSRLDQLVKAWYPDDAVSAEARLAKQDPLDPMTTGTVINPLPSPAKFNRVKFLELLQAVLRTEKKNIGLCVEALCCLSIDDVTEILTDEATSPRLMVACLAAGDKDCKRDETRGQSSPTGRRQPSEIADAARRCLLSAIRGLLTSVPKDFRSEYRTRDYSVLKDCDASICERILGLAGGVYRLFKNDRLKSTLTESELRLLISYLVILSTVCLKRLDSIKLCHGRRLANVFVAALCSEHLCRIICSNEFLEQQMHLVAGAFWLCYKALNMKELMSLVDDLPFVLEDGGLRVTWQYATAYMRWIESRGPEPLRNHERVAKDLFVALCRLPFLTSYTHIPPSAFKFGWAPEVKTAPNGYPSLPTVPVHYLQNVETLREFICRVNLLGWSSRQQFEEIWMGLLGVLSATTIGQELLNNSVQETEDRIVASSFAVRCLSALVLQTLLAPIPGNPVSSVYIFKQRENHSTFLKTTLGAKLGDLRHCLRHQMNGTLNDSPQFGYNPERLHNFTCYSSGQLSIETLWALTGILEEERDMLSGLHQPPAPKGISGWRVSEAYEARFSAETPEKEVQWRSSRGSSFVSYCDDLLVDNQAKVTQAPEEFMAVRRSTSNFLLISESGLDLVSCLHFLLDLFTHWFAGGPDDIPLVLLAATVESVTYLSDLFSERAQYVWLKERLSAVYHSRFIEDEIMLQDVLLGLLKCSAVLGVNDTERQKEMTSLIDIGLHNPQLSVRLATVHGVLYVLQTLTSDETITLMPLLTDYVLPHMSLVISDDLVRNLEKPQSLEHQLAIWALGFYIVEAFHDPHTKASFGTKFTEHCLKALQTDSVPIILSDCIVNGLESLLVSTSLDARLAAQLTKLATECVQQPSSPRAGVLALELLMTCLYTSKGSQRFGDATTPDDGAPRTAGEPHISAMERLTVLLNRVTGGSSLEASAIGSILPDFLRDHFSPSDVMNKVIIEVLSPVQPHPHVLIRALHSLIEALLQQEVPAVVCDWIVVSLPSFTCKNPVHFSVWALTCLLLSASTNSWVQALWPLAMSRYKECESDLDSRLFCFAILAFHSQLQEKSQVDSLFTTIRKAAERHPHSAYSRALEHLLAVEPDRAIANS